jgi:carbon monoxide dehydrogenase subunit G
VQLEHSFTVSTGIDDAWTILLDIERVAPCVPGAELDSVDGDDFAGSLRVKLGPIDLTYRGEARFIEKDAAAHKVIMEARGRDTRDNGTATATVSTVLTADGENSTKVVVATDLNVTGKPAQFGRSVMLDVGDKLIGQFAHCLAAKLARADEVEPGEPGPSTPAAADSAPARHTPSDSPVAIPAPTVAAPEPFDVMALAIPMAKRLAPIAAGLIGLAVAFFILVRRRQR